MDPPAPPSSPKHHSGGMGPPGMVPGAGDCETPSREERENGVLVTAQDVDTESDRSPPAVVIYMVDPFSHGGSGGNPELSRLASLGLLKCFSQLLPHFKAGLRDNIFLQLVSLDSVLELGLGVNQAKTPNVMRGLAFSVFSQAQRIMTYQTDCKTLTGTINSILKIIGFYSKRL